MFLLKTEEDQNDFIFYWTLDGEHIFRIQRKPKLKKGNTKQWNTYLPQF